jgi:glycosyltransferase involved in cell wall biosynthesis
MTGASGRRLTILSRSQGARFDGIRDHAVSLAAAVNAKPGWEAKSLDLNEDQPRDLSAVLQLHHAHLQHTLLLQYNPFSFGRRGLAPWLPLALSALRRSYPSLSIAVLVHEPFVPPLTVKWAVLHAAQRAQLAVIARLADVRIATTHRWATVVPGGAWVLPVGSNVPDRRYSRRMTRQRLGVDPQTVVVAAFGTDHPSRLPDWLVAGIQGVERATPNFTGLNLGATAPSLGQTSDWFTPGALDADTLADYLAGADLFLAPFVDGISTRRTTVMAALQHGMPVIGNRGRGTGEELLYSDGVVLVHDDRRDLFGDAARHLAADCAERRWRGLAARRLYETYFAWEVLADRLIDFLTMPVARKGRGAR